MDITPSRDQVVLFEPRAGVPVSGQPALHDLLLGTPWRQLLNPLRWLVIVIGVSGLLLPGHPLGLAGPVLLAAVSLTGLVLTVRGIRFVSPAELAALAASPPRQVTLGEGDLWRSGRNVAIRLRDEDRWVVARLPVADVMMLARRHRIWVFGPSPGGRIGLMVPGGRGPRTTRLVAAPPAGAEPVPEPAVPAEWPPPPRDDPALRFALRSLLLNSVSTLALLAAAFGWLAVDLPAFGPLRTGVGIDVARSVLILAVAIIVLATFADLRRIVRAGRSPRWAWTRVVVDSPTTFQPGVWKLPVRVDVPGAEIHLEVFGPPAFVLAVHESGQLWVIGELHSKRRRMAGIPEVPTMGGVRVVRQAR